MNYNENPPQEKLEQMYLDGMTEEYIHYLCLQAQYESWIDTISDRLPLSASAQVELSILINELEALRYDLADHRSNFCNNPFRNG